MGYLDNLITNDLQLKHYSNSELRNNEKTSRLLINSEALNKNAKSEIMKSVITENKYSSEEQIINIRYKVNDRVVNSEIANRLHLETNPQKNTQNISNEKKSKKTESSSSNDSKIENRIVKDKNGGYFLTLNEEQISDLNAYKNSNEIQGIKGRYSNSQMKGNLVNLEF